MRVPVYQRQAKRSQAGGGQFLTASLASNAMSGTAEALGAVGDLISEIGIKKMQIQTQTQIDEAENSMLLELSEIKDEALKLFDPVAAEEATKTKMNNLLQKYSSGRAINKATGNPMLSGRNAKARFIAKGQALLSTATIDFVKANNARILEQDRVNLDNTVNKSVQIASDTSLDVTQRADAFSNIFNMSEHPDGIVSGVLAKGKAGGTLDAKSFMTRVDQATESIVRGTALNLMRGSDDATATMLQIVNGESTDIVLNSALSQMDPGDKGKVVSSLMTLAEKIDTERRQQREANDKIADKANADMFSQIINVDKTKDDAIAAAKTKHKTLLENNWYKPNQRDQAEKVLGLNKKPAKESPAKSDRISIKTLRAAVRENMLTPAMVENHKSELSDSDYEQYLGFLDSEKKEGVTAARTSIKNATRYNEFKDSNDVLSGASEGAYFRSIAELDTWLNTPEGQKSTYQTVIKKARDINKANEQEFKDDMKAALIAYLTQLSTMASYDGLPVDVNTPAATALTHLSQMNQSMIVVNLTSQIRSYQKIGIE